MDEPCSALDPISTGKIEELIFQLKEQYTIVIVTHNMQQAARVAEFTGFFLLGKMIEFDKTEKDISRIPPTSGRKITSQADSDKEVRIMRTRFQQQMESYGRNCSAWEVWRSSRWTAPARPTPSAISRAARLVLENESLINAAEREIDEMAFDILATQQPTAVDLRFILAVTKINADLERVGDQAVNIAERVMDLIELPAVDLPVDIARMATAVSAMVRRALESFIEGKAELAQAVLEMDHVVDRMRDEAFIVLVRSMNEQPQSTQQALDALLVARNLERVADHATNIAEDVIFWVLGADVRHHAQAAASSQPEKTGT